MYNTAQECARRVRQRERNTARRIIKARNMKQVVIETVRAKKNRLRKVRAKLNRRIEEIVRRQR